MDSPQSVVSPFKTGESENENSTSVQSSGNGNKSNAIVSDLVGTLEVHVHQARDIHNICIYHKQDVYAKLCLTSDPLNSVSTKIINGGGRDPVFDDKLKLHVRAALDTSLKCEIYMMSRVRNYLEDQLLGFTLVPMSELLFKNGKLDKEFALSSSDLYHSPAGFVQLSLSYNGSYPEVMMAFPTMPSSVSVDESTKNPQGSESLPDELDKIEFPDPNVANENEKMVSEYFGISCSTVDSETSDSLVTSDHVTNSVTSVLKQDSPEINNATNEAASPHASAHSATETPNHDHLPLVKSKADSQEESESEASGETSKEKTVKPILSVRVEPESKVVQQDIVDMYMKSMQQFTDSLAKMKLPLDIDSPTKSDNSSSDSQKLPTPKSNNNGSRVFYGSRPFF